MKEGGHQWTLDQKQTQEMLAKAFDLDVNFIDTANVYAGGTSEEYIGKALKNLNVARDKVVIASKGSCHHRQYLILTDEDVKYLDEVYVPHNIVGALEAK